MITLPFTVSCVETAPPGTLDVSIRFPACGPGSDGLRLTQHMMADFIRVATDGGLAGSRLQPIDSTLSLAEERIAADVCVWKFDGAQIAPGARMVLENIVQFLHLNITPVSQLDISVPFGSEMATLQNAPPKLYTPIPFQYLYEVESSEVTIDIEFKHPVEDENLRNQFAHFWESWLYISAAGGFETEDFSSRRLTIFPADEPDSRPEEITLFMDDVSVDDNAFDALVNGFHKLHFTTAPLSFLRIY
jgi:hypothetical protein